MSEVKLTAAQQAVVDYEGGALLVSAAAGSGKTKVLVDRLMRTVCDPLSPRNVDEFLIITYTKAAAAELRGKISAELSRRLALQPANRHLQRQTSRIYLAEISTVHAFCANLLRDYAHVLDIPSDFRIAEAEECAVLRQRCLEQILEEAYQNLDELPELRAMTDQLGYGRNDSGISAAVETLYEAMQCQPNPAKWLEDCRVALTISAEQDCGETPWGAYLLKQFSKFLQTQSFNMRAAIAEMQGISQLENGYQPVFQRNLELLDRLAQLDSWSEITAAIMEDTGRLSGVRNFEDKTLLERLKGIRTRCIDGIKEWRLVFSAPGSELMAELAASADALRGALEIVARFTKRFLREKRRRHIMDFNDLEHEAIRLLVAPNGKPTASAQEISQRYVEVMVDEYQDSNAVQECIFSAIARDGKNRFMVGDVKQSIYRFRLADPTIFLEKYKAYPEHTQAKGGEASKILLSENFRSRPEILSAVNHVFRTVMSESVGDLTYGDEESLKAGLHFMPLQEPVVELHCMEPAAGEDEEGGESKGETESKFVADRIVRLLAEGTITGTDSTRAVRPEDIVILLHSPGSVASEYLAALRARGVPCYCDRGESALDSQEVEVACAILQIIDNPHRDVPLASVLSSPVFGFTAEELSAIRTHSRKSDFYDALNAFAEKSEKVTEFLTLLGDLRRRARRLPLHSLIHLVFTQTRIEAIYGAFENGAQRRMNLQAFFEYGVQFASDGTKTLMDLLEDIARKREKNLALSSATAPEGGAVQIMSIHKSKGLEFPIVILADLSRRFNTEDLRKQVATHPALYAASNAVDFEQGVRYPTLAKRAISMRIREENRSEELRVLYVAMTRAKNRLIMSYCSRYLQSELSGIAAEAAMPAKPDFAARARNPGYWVLMAAMCRIEAGELFNYAGNPEQAYVLDDPWEIRLHTMFTPYEKSLDALKTASVNLNAPDAQTLSAMLAFSYPNIAASTIPTKLTATQLKGRTIDDEIAESAAEILPQRRVQLRRPEFVTEQYGLTPTERGTANHLFLQFADYACCTSAEGVSGELSRMVAHEFLTTEQAEAVAITEIVGLFSSALGARILQAEHVTREMKFSIHVDASDYFKDVQGEKVLLQGVVDCLIEEPDGLTVVDFKTDAVTAGNEAERAAYYRGQVNTYAMALSRIYGIPVKEQLLYFLKTGAAIAVQP